VEDLEEEVEEQSYPIEALEDQQHRLLGRLEDGHLGVRERWSALEDRWFVHYGAIGVVP